MVYVAKDGSVHPTQPWGLEKIMGLLGGFVNMIIAFFQTMLPIEGPPPKNNLKKSGGGGGWGSGGGGGGGGGGGYPRGGGRPGSNIRGLGSLPPSGPPSCGSCCGR